MVRFRIPPLKNDCELTIKRDLESLFKIYQKATEYKNVTKYTQFACVGHLLGSGERGVVLSGSRPKCVSKEHGTCLKDSLALSMEATEWGLVGGCRLMPDYEI